MLDEFKVKHCEGIHVICNAFSFNKEKEVEYINIRDLYGLNQNALILLCVGNICHRKNQKQVVDAFNCLADDLKHKAFVLFLGRDIEPDYSFKEYVNSNDYKDHFVLCGNVDKEYVPFYYQQANGVVLLSISEGFGLSLIEGMHFGKPCITFTDLDAYEDIKCDCAVVGLSDRSDETVAKGLECLINHQWDQFAIKEHSRQFESEQMAENYINTFIKIIG